MTVTAYQTIPSRHDGTCDYPAWTPRFDEASTRNYAARCQESEVWSAAQRGRPDDYNRYRVEVVQITQVDGVIELRPRGPRGGAAQTIDRIVRNLTQHEDGSITGTIQHGCQSMPVVLDRDRQTWRLA